ncbi:hypothetical protein [Brevibacterium linens]|uniref:hypothetical protein n=1 Tax=Brevibacterium linens TaxID=1703 RepID=UPI003BF5242A
MPNPDESCVSGVLTTDVLSAETNTKQTQPAAGASWVLNAEDNAEIDRGLTDSRGRFKACNSDGKIATANMEFSAQRDSLWKVVQPKTTDQVYSFSTGEFAVDDKTADLGNIAVPARMGGAFVISSAASKLYALRATDSPCWTKHQASLNDCHSVVVTWADDVPDEDGGYWDKGHTGHVILSGTDARSQYVIVHEVGHWWQNELYDGEFPEVTDCNPHYIDAPSSPSCAWTEGFADAVAGWVLGEPHFVASDGQKTPFVPEDSTAWPGGDRTQGNVAASLIDLWDLDSQDGTWAANVKLMSAEVDADFRSHFSNSRSLTGLTTTGEALAIVRKHGIDY